MVVRTKSLANVDKREFIKRMLGAHRLGVKARKSALGTTAAAETWDSSDRPQKWS